MENALDDMYKEDFCAFWNSYSPIPFTYQEAVEFLLGNTNKMPMTSSNALQVSLNGGGVVSKAYSSYYESFVATIPKSFSKGKTARITKWAMGESKYYSTAGEYLGAFGLAYGTTQLNSNNRDCINYIESH
jgi:hypothetical protein